MVAMVMLRATLLAAACSRGVSVALVRQPEGDDVEVRQLAKTATRSKVMHFGLGRLSMDELEAMAMADDVYSLDETKDSYKSATAFALEVNNSVFTMGAQIIFKKMLVKLNLYDTALYIDRDSPVWTVGETLTSDELLKALPGHAYFVMKVRSKYFTNQKLAQVTHELDAFVEDTTEAHDAVLKYADLWTNAPKIHRGSLIRADILPDGVGITIDGQFQGIVNAPHLGEVQADVYLNGDTAFKEEVMRRVSAGHPTVVSPLVTCMAS